MAGRNLGVTKYDTNGFFEVILCLVAVSLPFIFVWQLWGHAQHVYGG